MQTYINSTKRIKVFIPFSKVTHRPISLSPDITARKRSRFLRKLHMSHFALTAYRARETHLILLTINSSMGQNEIKS